jgi:beta-phosphoglucomutase-like phosphatase (HAD superfamily)
MSDRKIVTEQVDDVSLWEFDGTLTNAMRVIQDLIAKHGPEARLYYNAHFYYPYESSPSPRYEITIKREENDAELNKRLVEEAEQTRQREKRELEEFKRLSEKFGAK